MSTKIIELKETQTKPEPRVSFVPGENTTSDSIFAELDSPLRNVNVRSVSPSQTESHPTLSTQEEQEAYRRGVTQFHQDLFYQAIDEFKTIVYGGSDPTLRANSQYWIGRCYYEKGLYDEAIRALEQVQRFEHSDKRDDALVMIALAFKNKGRLEEAKLAFQELLIQHPGSEYLTLARRFVKE